MELPWPSLRRWTLKTLLPLTKIINKIHVPETRDVTINQAMEATRLVLPGDVLTVYAAGYATNLIIPGRYKHVAMYVGDVNGNKTVIEALGDGVRFTPLVKFLTAKDLVLIVRAKFCDATMAEQAVVYAKTLAGMPYDYLIEYSADSRVNKAFYCSEIPWWSYSRAMVAAGQKSPFEPRMTMGVPTVTPQDYANATDKWAVVGQWPSAIV